MLRKQHSSRSKARSLEASEAAKPLGENICMTMTVLLPGGCACGAVRYECSAEPALSLNCHCRDCQLASGSAFGSFLLVWADSFRLLAGEPKFYRRISDSGNPMLRGFCSECGSPLIIRAPHRPKLVFIHAASLDDPGWHKPTMDVFTASAQPWDVMNSDLQKFTAGPPVPESLGR